MPLFEFDQVTVTRLDPESALVSKAVKAPLKNLILIQNVTAGSLYPNLVSRIDKEGGDLNFFFGEDQDE